jgi:hypothetical protein
MRRIRQNCIIRRICRKHLMYDVITYCKNAYRATARLYMLVLTLSETARILFTGEKCITEYGTSGEMIAGENAFRT